MRIWDIEPVKLCRKHLLAEHRELHGLWSILANDMQGYRNHPETKRWEGKLAALFTRHELLVAEMAQRGYRHVTPLDPHLATGASVQDVLLHTLEQQEQLLTDKNCDCVLPTS